MTKTIDSHIFRQTMGCFATGIAVVTAHNDKFGAFGLTVNSLTSVSLDPPLILFCIDKNASLHAAFRRADRFAVNILAAGQEDVSRHFASRHHHGQPKKIWDKPQGETPILRGTLGWLLCRRHKLYAGGDHTIIVGEVVDLRKRPGAKEPLVYFHGRYRGLES
ncbi:MAG: flavin reductase family protein [Alphaproteobacteria bacterium]|nr:flavin reductase family protein [Alphaproteobacteria bacterium]